MSGRKVLKGPLRLLIRERYLLGIVWGSGIMSCPNPLHSPGVAVDAREEKSRKLSGIFNVFGKFAIDVGEDLSARARKRLPQAQKTADLGRRARTRHADGAAPVSQDKEGATAY